MTSHNDPRTWCHERKVRFLLKRQTSAHNTPRARAFITLLHGSGHPTLVSESQCTNTNQPTSHPIVLKHNLLYTLQTPSPPPRKKKNTHTQKPKTTLVFLFFWHLSYKIENREVDHVHLECLEHKMLYRYLTFLYSCKHLIFPINAVVAYSGKVYFITFHISKMYSVVKWLKGHDLMWKSLKT